MILATTILIQLLVLIAAAPLDSDTDLRNGTAHSPHQARQIRGKNVPLYIVGSRSGPRFPAVQVNVGGEAYNVLFDTASYRSLMFDKTVTGMGAHSHGRRLYDSKGSRLSKDHCPKIEFGGEVYSGSYVQDTWSLETSGRDSVPASHTKVTKVRGMAMPAGFSGLLGFAPVLKNSVMAKLSAKWSAKEFSVHLTPTGGQLTVGGYNRDCLAAGETFEYVPVVSRRKDKWIVETRLEAGTKRFDTKLHLDTGAKFKSLNGPAAEVDELLVEMGFNRQTGHVPCTGTADMNFDFNGKVITIPYTDLVEQDGNGCRPLVAPKKNGVDYWTIGTPIFKHLYANFKLTTPAKVGIAKIGARGSCTSVTTISNLPPMSAAKPAKPHRGSPGSGSGSGSNKHLLSPGGSSSNPGSPSNKRPRPPSPGAGGSGSSRQSSPSSGSNKRLRPGSPKRQGSTSPGSPGKKKKRP